MIRGTTPTHTFTLPFDVSVIKEIHVIYAQGRVKLVKKKADCELSGNEVKVRLSQEETLMFCAALPFKVQVRVLTHIGDALASVPKTVVDVIGTLEDEVIK